jgi:hypothetical protein
MKLGGDNRKMCEVCDNNKLGAFFGMPKSKHYLETHALKYV